jgi:hypothetical protein
MNSLGIEYIYVCRLIPALTVVALTVINGCVIVPIPSYGGVGVITQETVESLKPEKSTRADVLHLLGDPSERIEDDRFFVYRWEKYGGAVVVILFVDRVFGPFVEVHYLVMEFTTDNRLKRLTFIDGGRDLLDKLLDQWTKETD